MTCFEAEQYNDLESSFTSCSARRFTCCLSLVHGVLMLVVPGPIELVVQVNAKSSVAVEIKPLSDRRWFESFLAPVTNYQP